MLFTEHSFASSVTGNYIETDGKTPVNLDLNTKSNSYDNYIESYKNEKLPTETIKIKLENFKSDNEEVEIQNDFNGRSGKTIITQDNGYVEWAFNVATAGLYSIYLDYYPVEGKSSSIERRLLLDGEQPFDESMSFLFSRVWTNANSIKQDNRGNDITPTQKESPRWITSVFADITGYYDEPFKFYLSSGSHTLRLEAIREPLAIGEIRLQNLPDPENYEQVKKAYDDAGLKPVETGTNIKIQAEDADYKSNPVLTPIFDRSSPTTEPYSPSLLRLNSIGGARWSIPGQWVEWVIDAPKDGLYRLAFKIRENLVRGVFITRRLTIDGQIPFSEAGRLTFFYNRNWQMFVPGGAEDPYLFNLSKGRHIIRLESTLGDISKYLRSAEKSVYELNQAYRKIIMITGVNPDINRDYLLEKQLPNVINIFKQNSEDLKKLSTDLALTSGEKSSFTGLLDTLSYQLKNMAEKPELIPRKLTDFNYNVTSLGAWIVYIRSTPLEMDYLVVGSPEDILPKADANIFGKITHELRAFIESFFVDYSTLGDKAGNGRKITVWINSGRDQATILKNMIDSFFTPEANISVDMKLVQGALLQATVAGIGPDVALSLAGSDPVNYAARKAVVDLSICPDFKNIVACFNDSAITPFKYNGGVYALPERESFPMLFFRKDILDELGLKPPDTWEDLYNMLPVLQRYNMNMGMPISDLSTGAAVGGQSILTYGMLLYQKGGSFYMNDGSGSALDTEIAIQAFKQWSELYTAYKLPAGYDMATRFRTGEMPIGIADYTFYNLLVAFAPELRGQWSFTPVPGTVQKNGTIDRSVPNSVSGSVIFKSAKDKAAAWSFLKWWTREDIQVEFGRGLESVMGETARYPTANIAALDRLPWATKDYKSLKEQWKFVKGIPEVPGGYFTGRHIDNAFRQVINYGDDPREVILDYVRVINLEIDAKRSEFGLKR